MAPSSGSCYAISPAASPRTPRGVRGWQERLETRRQGGGVPEEQCGVDIRRLDTACGSGRVRRHFRRPPTKGSATVDRHPRFSFQSEFTTLAPETPPSTTARLLPGLERYRPTAVRRFVFGLVHLQWWVPVRQAEPAEPHGDAPRGIELL